MTDERNRYDEQLEPLSERDWRWIVATLVLLGLFWFGVIWLARWVMGG